MERESGKKEGQGKKAMISGMPQQRLDEIQLRLIGADHRPWTLSDPRLLDSEGRRMVVMAGRKEVKKAIQAGYKAAVAQGRSPTAEEVDRDRVGKDVKVDMNVAVDRFILFKRSHNATDDMLSFIAHAPKDIEDLLSEVFCLKEMVKKLKEKKDEAVQELLTKRVEASRNEEKVLDMRRAWRTLCKEMGARPGQ